MAPFLLAPKLATENIEEVHYGYSFLFSNIGTNTVRIVAIVEADVQFFKYDGHQYHAPGNYKLNTEYDIVEQFSSLGL